ncbi:MAG: hypothetical protein QNJ40_21025 [Xanthomonadales bacterium]|nr:hypothetical protein [Xanthomonadales bacterium]
MNIQENLLTLIRAASFAVLSVGLLGTGLGLTTYTVEKANELVFSSPVVVESPVTDPAHCPVE